ncbi:hypothetical protein H0I57_21175 [Yersinia enterocolitica]|uniref:hypothetical protein n=1 Tax=Yersinia enterocolitica TaxID=630 RepID=UPI001CA51D16|nr:hypothetical protein [Yersinia enterocolitica]MBW5861752.1 hypothetical protein [Yersinia enterocolitica]MBW5874791.1 hypothetical protein [Yersinia enterocolitica]
MHILVIAASVILIVLLFGYIAIIRGRKSVRAYIYLIQRETGTDIETANQIAAHVTTQVAASYRSAAMRYCYQYHEGNQLMMIKDARKQGFTG